MGLNCPCLCSVKIGDRYMTQLRSEYTDIKSIKHRVEHLTLPSAHSADKERLVEELARALTSGSTPFVSFGH